MDTSTVFHIGLLDAEFAAAHDPAEPWIFETDDGQFSCSTEAEACALQRNYRRARGYDPLSGERLFKRC